MSYKFISQRTPAKMTVYASNFFPIIYNKKLPKITNLFLLTTDYLTTENTDKTCPQITQIIADDFFVLYLKNNLRLSRNLRTTFLFSVSFDEKKVPIDTKQKFMIYVEPVFISVRKQVQRRTDTMFRRNIAYYSEFISKAVQQ
jgi:hypothetical protein